MQINSISPPTNSFFTSLRDEIQRETLALIDEVNKCHLHCEDTPTWEKVHKLIIDFYSTYLEKKIEKQTQPVTAPQAATPQQDDPNRTRIFGNRIFSQIYSLDQSTYQKLLRSLGKDLQSTFHDPLFTDPILEALQNHIMTPLHNNAELVALLCSWIQCNSIYLPLGTHLLPAFKKDMDLETQSAFAKHVLAHEKIIVIPEASSQKSFDQMTAFLAEAAQAHCRSCDVPTQPPNEKPTAVMLSVKNGAGGHTAPTHAMAARLKERGWRVETIYYDTDLSNDCDPFQLLGITFEDGSPMTESLYITRWKMPKRKKNVARIVGYYVQANKILNPDLFKDDSGGDLLRHRILPLNPQLLITTLAYHWIWKTLAYRVTSAKTLLVASDVFFHREAIMPWYRQQDIPHHLRQMHFTAMTDDLLLLKSMANHHDQYYIKKYPNFPVRSMIPLIKGLHLDSQIKVIGAPIHPSFKAITESQEIQRLRSKWKLPDGAMSICISRGKLGFDSDFMPALEEYRTQETFPRPVVLQVVCGENTPFYERLRAGEYGDLGPNITINPNPLLAPGDFAELRAISTFDDIKAGGGSTFEGWYLISEGSQCMLLLTPGPDLWWERSNCDAMEKWGVGKTITAESRRAEIIKEVMENGLPKISNRFPDWKVPFDEVVDLLKVKK